MDIPKDKRYVHVKCQEDEDEIYWHNEKNDETIKIVYKHWKGGHMPRLPICKKQFIKLCQTHPRAQDLCAWFKVDHDTLVSWAKKTFIDYNFKTISDLITQLGGKFTFGLRKFLWDHAQKSPQACIFLAKNYLGLRDQMPDDVQDISVETLNYSMAEGKTLGLWAKTAKLGEITDAGVE